MLKHKKEMKTKTTDILLFVFLLFLFLIIPLSLADNLNPLDRLPYMYDSITPKISDLKSDSASYLDVFTGSMGYTYNIKVPPGTNGLTPSIKFVYNSQSTYNNPQILGSGWRLSENYIKRNINYTLTNTSDDTFQLMFDGNLYDLVYVPSENRFHTKVEAYFYIENKTGAPNARGQYWVLRTKEGTNYRFGYNPNSELLSNMYNFTSKWSLDLINDTYNNSIFYQYAENPFSSDIGAIYLSNITYNNDQSRRIEFIYEDSNRLDLRYVYDQGNKFQESRRLIWTYITFNNSLVNRYLIIYQSIYQNPYPYTKNSINHISSYGSNEYSSPLASVKFNYYNPLTNWNNISNVYNVPECSNTQSSGCFVDSDHYDNGIRLADVNGDGLVDIVKASQSSDTKTWINNGTGWVESNLYSKVPNCYPGGFMCFINSNHVDNGVRLIDVNGDGLPDLVRGNGMYINSSIYLNDGKYWNYQSPWEIYNSLPECDSSNQTGCFILDDKDNGVRLIDVNGDGFVDIIRGNSRASPYSRIWINTGIGWAYDSKWNLPACTSGDTSSCFVDNTNDTGVRIEDVNGDGLPDLVRGNGKINGLYARTWINNGSGWTQDDNWKIPWCDSSTNYGCFVVSNLRKDNGVRFADVNGDGLPDLVRGNGKTDPYTETWINTGDGWEIVNGWNIPSCTSSNKVGCFIDFNQLDNGVRLVDVNGDGAVDIIRGNGASSPYTTTFVNNFTKPYLLSNITNEFGGITKIDYKSSTINQGSSSQLPFNIWIVSNKTNSISYPTQYQETTNYYYSGGYYDFNSKEFRGFNSVYEQIYNYSQYYKQPYFNYFRWHFFNQGSGNSGKEYSDYIGSNDFSPLEDTHYSWSNTQRDGYWISLLQSEVYESIDGNYESDIQKTINYNYDEFGNPTLISYLGDSNINGDEKYEYYEYINNSASWIVNKPKHYYLLDSDNSTLVRQTWYAYDGLNYSQPPTKGSVTRKYDYLNQTKNITNLYSYNSHGDLINQTDPNGQVTRYIYGTKDTTFTYPDSVINPLNYATNYTYDIGTGNKLSVRDPNGIYTNYTYDSFGRIIKEIQPYDTLNDSTINYVYTFDGVPPENIKISQKEVQEGGTYFDTYNFYDDFGRLIQTKKESDNGKQIVTDYYYDLLGRLQKQSNPYFVDFSESYSNAHQSVPYTTYYYDNLNRLVAIFNSDNTNKTNNYYHGIINSTDENGNKKVYYNDAYNRITNILEYINSTGYFNTSYKYNPIDNLISIKDNNGNNITFEYDKLGRKTKLSDPDLGTLNYTYDANGNLIDQRDSKNNYISFTYDNLNRLTAKQGYLGLVTYEYDVDKKGTLSRISTPSSYTQYYYDGRLRKTSEEVDIDSIPFVTSWTYDPMNRVTSVTLPNGNTTHYYYNDQGELFALGENTIIIGDEFIQDILPTIAYNEKSEISSREYGNNLTTTYNYNNTNFRLLQIKTGNKQDLNYTYDSIGNIIQIKDSIHSRIYSMGYDSLDRLINTVMTATGANGFNYTYTYDPIGNLMNMTSNGQVKSFVYGTSPIHAPSNLIDIS